MKVISMSAAAFSQFREFRFLPDKSLCSMTSLTEAFCASVMLKKRLSAVKINTATSALARIAKEEVKEEAG